MQNFLNLQCAHSELAFPRWGLEWVDVKKIFSNWFGVRRCGITKMLAYLEMEFEGQQHSGLDDSKNIARILIQLMKDGCPVEVNSKLKNCLSHVEPSDKAKKKNETP